MGRTLREQWADDWLRIVVEVFLWIMTVAGAAVVGWVKHMGNLEWIVLWVVGCILFAVLGRIIISRHGRTKDKSKPGIDISTLLFEGDLVQGLGTPEVYYTHDGKRHWLASPKIADQINPQRSTLTFIVPPVLLNRIPLGPHIETLKDAKKFLGIKLQKGEKQ